ncbi:integration host factor subunit alpha [Geomobilimonas luticola]|uniref:Integration host factor subunit alpha n=1 Tax=Geomobilimonas luticola TaxID=1114878 RepID=A0ABS5S8H9_9BACT|nr:integration host factor subunit alpha [Geomobilimonas luticola]MBT0651455.1 integration host factor subunit alpha [Geomobilimonas luticola]
MTKACIAEKIHVTTGFSLKESADMLETTFSIIKSTLEAGENIRITGFGNFEVKQKHDRRGRNPHTGETIRISARKVLTFKPSTILRHAINRQP